MTEGKRGKPLKRKIITAVFLMVGGSAGITALPYLWELAGIQNNLFNNVFVNFGVGALIFYLLSFLLMKLILDVMQKIENYFSTLSVSYMLFGSIGTIIGLVLAWLIGIPLTSLRIPVINDVLPAILSLILAYLGFRVGTTRIEEFRKLFAAKPKKQEETQMLDRKADDTFRKYKILDTSVIIDGRIYDIAKTGFLEGVIVIPNFVLRELQYIADSSDSLKRVRGRRGLDILNKLQKEEDIVVESYEGEFEEIPEVDSKLIRLAKLIDGIVITNDYNLNKVADIEGVMVLNVNELAQNLRPTALPGELKTIKIVQKGSGREQGVGYLDDGTMVVVEGCAHNIGKKVDIEVTRIHQTVAGKMIFANIKTR